MPDTMTIAEFVTNCVKYGIEFEVTHYERRIRRILPTYHSR